MDSTITIIPFLHKVSDLILNPLILLAFVLSSVYFAYGVVKFLSLGAADKSRDEARKAILWGMVGMLIMFSVYGLIKFILATFGISENDPSLLNARSFIKI
jgi:hypothetical protein